MSVFTLTRPIGIAPQKGVGALSGCCSDEGPCACTLVSPRSLGANGQTQVPNEIYDQRKWPPRVIHTQRLFQRATFGLFKRGKGMSGLFGSCAVQITNCSLTRAWASLISAQSIKNGHSRNNPPEVPSEQNHEDTSVWVCVFTS